MIDPKSPMPALGIDLGTTSIKALVVDDDGAILASADAGQDVAMLHEGWAEQDPEVWWSGTTRAVRAVLAATPGGADSIAGVGVCGQMHGLVLLDRAGSALRPCILWNDQRAAAECDAIIDRLGIAELVRRTGNRVFPGFSLPKLLWVRRHEPELAQRIASILLPKDWLTWRLAGSPRASEDSSVDAATDPSDASGTALFDCGARAWSTSMVETFGVDLHSLPRVAESAQLIGAVDRAVSAATGLRVGTPIVAGAGDQAASALGMGIVDAGAVSVTIGTSGVVFASRDHHAPDAAGRLHAFCHALPDRWHQMGVMLSAGGSLRWFRDALVPEIASAARTAGRDPYDALAAMADEVPNGADGITFLPYLSGERTPYADAAARGAFIGIGVRHDRRHLARAVFEGITFGLADSLELIRAGGAAPPRVRLAGGAARSAFWRQLCADVFRCEVEVAPDLGGAAGALGAALLARAGAEGHASVESIARASHATRTAGSLVVRPSSPCAAGTAVQQALQQRLQQALQQAQDRYRSLSAIPQVRHPQYGGDEPR